MDRATFSLRAIGVKPDRNNPLRSGVHSRGYLPHVKREGASYFVTFRLADSLPREVLAKMEERRAQRLQSLNAQLEAFDRGITKQVPRDSEEEINRTFRREVERYLDRGVGECHLAKQEFAELVANAMRFFEGQRYRLSAWVIMPNHVHVVIWPIPNYLLSDILGSWKGFTGRKANQILKRVGQPFWQPESFDHWIRNDEEKARICRYVIYNPVKAKLSKTPEEWLWSSGWPGWTSRTTH